MAEVILRASKTQSYAQRSPDLPHTTVFKDKDHALPLGIAERIVALGGGEILSQPEQEVDKINPESKEGDGSKVDPEPKEGSNKTEFSQKVFGSKRKAGQKRNN